MRFILPFYILWENITFLAWKKMFKGRKPFVVFSFTWHLQKHSAVLCNHKTKNTTFSLKQSEGCSSWLHICQFIHPSIVRLTSLLGCRRLETFQDDSHQYKNGFWLNLIKLGHSGHFFSKWYEILQRFIGLTIQHVFLHLVCSSGGGKINPK